jgi:hypothetical protein
MMGETKKLQSRVFTLVVTLCFAVSSISCGTLMHSERILSRPSDKLDGKTVALDCLWLLPGLVPGVVALGVDFHNDAIYYSRSELEAMKKGKKVRLRIPSIAPTGWKNPRSEMSRRGEEDVTSS